MKKTPFMPIVLSLNACLMLIAMVLGWQKGDVARYYYEGQLMTWWSAFQLAATGLLCLLVMELKADRLHRQFWGLAALGFVYMAFDEGLMWHEGMDGLIHQWLHIKETGLSDRLDDLIVLLYIVIGLRVSWFYRSQWWPQWSLLKPLFWPLFGLLAYMVLADMLSNRQDIIGNTRLFLFLAESEDFIKPWCEFMLMLMVYRVYRDHLALIFFRHSHQQSGGM